MRGSQPAPRYPDVKVSWGGHHDPLEIIRIVTLALGEQVGWERASDFALEAVLLPTQNIYGALVDLVDRTVGRR